MPIVPAIGKGVSMTVLILLPRSPSAESIKAQPFPTAIRRATIFLQSLRARIIRVSEQNLPQLSAETSTRMFQPQLLLGWRGSAGLDT
jgi:hypothetical protein